MKFDDRLATILTSRVSDAHDLAVRWRQLVDLVSQAGAGASGPMIDEALKVIEGGRSEVPEPLRAAAARAIAGRELTPALLRVFAGDTLQVAAPLLAGVQPTSALLAAASPEVARLLGAAGEAADRFEPDPTLEPTAVASPPASVPSIGEVVARIEQLRASRAAGESEAAPLAPEPAEVAPAVPTEQPEPAPAVRERAHVPPTAIASASAPVSGAALFRWECNAGGEIGWVDGVPRGALVGRSLAHAAAESEADPQIERAFARRAPFSDAPMALAEDGALAGRWLFSGMPAFAPDDGRFVGYRGTARRGEAPAEKRSSPAIGETELRELVHEIRTPLNAIIGLAEMIDGQYLGPAQAGYRQRATEIVTQARHLLSAVEDLDFVARRSRGPAEADMSVDKVVTQLRGRLEAIAADRGISLLFEGATPTPACSVDPEVAGRLVERLVTAVLASAKRNEMLVLGWRASAGGCVVHLSKPASLRDKTAEDLLGPAANSSPLRFAAGLARMVGATVEAEGDELRLRFAGN